MTSHDVVARVRRIVGQKSVGHLGTLDPMATGVLPLVLGRFPRLAQFYNEADKRYEGTIRLGWATDTSTRKVSPWALNNWPISHCSRCRMLLWNLSAKLPSILHLFLPRKLPAFPLTVWHGKDSRWNSSPSRSKSKNLNFMIATGRRFASAPGSVREHIYALLHTIWEKSWVAADIWPRLNERLGGNFRFT